MALLRYFYRDFKIMKQLNYKNVKCKIQYQRAKTKIYNYKSSYFT